MARVALVTRVARVARVAGCKVLKSIAILTLMLIHGATTSPYTWLAGTATALCAFVLAAGLANFWTEKPTQLRCID